MNKKNIHLFFNILFIAILFSSTNSLYGRKRKKNHKSRTLLVAQAATPTIINPYDMSDPYDKIENKNKIEEKEEIRLDSLQRALPLELLHNTPKQPTNISSKAPISSDSAPTTIEETVEKTMVEKEIEQDLKLEPEQKVDIAEIKEDLKVKNIEFNFENSDLLSIIKFIEDLFGITFISDSSIQPLPKGASSLAGHKVKFKTNVPLSKKEAWDLFVTFLNMAGFAITLDPKPDCFRIKSLEDARKSPLPTFIGIDPELLPQNNELIRYVYFVENRNVEELKEIITKLKSNNADLIQLTNHKAFILTDKAYNIKMLMQIVKELDKVSMPQSMSVLKLQSHVSAQQVKELYDSLTKTDTSPQQFFQARKQQTALFFPENTTIIAEPRTNSLILLGTKDSIAKIEHFIKKHIDKDLDIPYTPFYIYQLKYAEATAIAEIMNSVTELGKDGGEGRDIIRHMKPISFIAEEITNRLIIKGHYDDYMIAKDIIDRLDSPQAQVAIEILILSVNISDAKKLGAQIRSKDPGADGFLGKNVKFQTSGLNQNKGIVPNTQQSSFGVTRLLGDLVSLAQGAISGNTVLTLGSDSFGIWGIFQALQTITNTQIVSNPFILATNKTPAQFSVGQTRRVQTGTIFSGGSSPIETLGDLKANLDLNVTPQINSDGMIVLNLSIDIVDFTDPNPDSKNATTTTRHIKTHAIVANNEVLALGGLIKNSIGRQGHQVPLLGKIPIIGWLFKNQAKQQEKDSLLILISSTIIEKHKTKDINTFNQERIKDYQGTLAAMQHPSDSKDPINRLFFDSNKNGTENLINNFIFTRANINIEDDNNRKAKKPKTRFQKRTHKKQEKLRKKQTESKPEQNPTDSVASTKPPDQNKQINQTTDQATYPKVQVPTSSARSMTTDSKTTSSAAATVSTSAAPTKTDFVQPAIPFSSKPNLQKQPNPNRNSVILAQRKKNNLSDFLRESKIDRTKI